MSSPRKKYAYLVIACLCPVGIMADSVVQIKRVEDRFVPYEFSVSTRMIIVLDGHYNPNSSKAIEATSIQSPFDRKPPNPSVPYSNRINIPWADSKSILLLSMECGYQKPPLDIHESVRTFVEGHIEYINQQLHSVGHEIVREMRLASFYETNQRYLRCKRRRNTIEWEIEVDMGGPRTPAHNDDVVHVDINFNPCNLLCG
jgi:hypothetical protein